MIGFCGDRRVLCGLAKISVACLKSAYFYNYVPECALYAGAFGFCVDTPGCCVTSFKLCGSRVPAFLN